MSVGEQSDAAGYDTPPHAGLFSEEQASWNALRKHDVMNDETVYVCKCPLLPSISEARGELVLLR